MVTSKKGTAAPKHRDDKAGVPKRGELSITERPGGKLEMPRSDRARDLRDDSNSNRDSNDLESGVST